MLNFQLYCSNDVGLATTFRVFLDHPLYVVGTPKNILISNICFYGDKIIPQLSSDSYINCYLFVLNDTYWAEF